MTQVFTLWQDTYYLPTIAVWDGQPSNQCIAVTQLVTQHSSTQHNLGYKEPPKEGYVSTI